MHSNKKKFTFSRIESVIKLYDARSNIKEVFKIWGVNNLNPSIFLIFLAWETKFLFKMMIPFNSFTRLLSLRLLPEKGLGKIDYVYGDYKYLTQLESSELMAKTSRFGIWQDSNEYIYYIIGGIVIIIIIIICIINKKFRSKILVKVKKKTKKEIKKMLN